MPTGPDKIIIKRLIWIAILAVVWFLLMLWADFPLKVERYYSEGIYPAICHIFHPVFNLFPFSVGDLIYIAVIICIIFAAVKFFRLLFSGDWKRWLAFSFGMVIRIEVAVLLFYSLWGMNYFRPSMGERMHLTDTAYTTELLTDVTRQLIDSANISRDRLTVADMRQVNDSIYQTAIRAIKKISADSPTFRTYHPRIKPSLLTPVLNYLATSGYYNPFTAESQLNYEVPYFERPFIACHEMSHQMGFGAEDEANFSGFLAGIGSKDRLMRYSCYQLGMDECLHALRFRDTAAFSSVRKLISPTVKADFRQERLYWLRFRGKVGHISGLFYDDFLKANNQPHGLETYNQMVLLLVTWHRGTGRL